MVYTHKAECPFCGAQLIITSVAENLTEEELMEEAASVCNCKEAKFDRSMKETEKKLQIALGEKSLDRGFNYAASEDTMNAVRGICEMILLDLIIGGVTLSIPGGDSLKLLKHKNAVKVTRDTKHRLMLD